MESATSLTASPLVMASVSSARRSLAQGPRYGAQDAVVAAGYDLDQAFGAFHRQGPAVGLEREDPRADVVAFRPGLLLGQADRGELGIGEDGHGQGPVKDGLPAARGVGRCGQALMRSLVGQELAADQVADGRRCRKRVFPEAGRLRYKPPRIRGRKGGPSKRRSELGFRPADSRTRSAESSKGSWVFSEKPFNVTRTVGYDGGLDLHLGLDLQALPLEQDFEAGGQLPVAAGQDLGQDFQDLDVRAQAAVDRAHLQADGPGADHEQGLGDFFEGQGLEARDHRTAVGLQKGQVGRAGCRWPG